jgi:hypothetical protein
MRDSSRQPEGSPREKKDGISWVYGLDGPERGELVKGTGKRTADIDGFSSGEAEVEADAPTGATGLQFVSDLIRAHETSPSKICCPGSELTLAVRRPEFGVAML